MSRIVTASLVLLCAVALTAYPQRGQANPFVGAWKIAEVFGPTAIANPQPSLYLFTAGHYSVMNVNGEKSRDPQTNDQSSDADKLAAWRQFTAHSGTYVVSENRITLRQLVAKNPNVMVPGTFVTFEFVVEGQDVIRLTQVANQRGEIPNGLRVLLKRIE